MGVKVFVPLTDEVLYEHPELISGPLHAYRPEWCGLRRLRATEARSRDQRSHDAHAAPQVPALGRLPGAPEPAAAGRR